MKYIYLDTSHLLKWVNGTLEKSEVGLLETFASCGHYLFVISDIHGIEISNRSDRPKMMETFKLIEKLPCIEFFTADELYKSEVICSYDRFNGKESEVSPFIPLDAANYFSSDNIDKLILSYAHQQKLHQDLVDVMAANLSSIIAAIDTSKDIFKNNLRDAFKQRLILAINNSGIVVNNGPEFVDFILKDPSLMPSLKLNFYSHINLYRNKGKKVIVNDWLDVLHFNAAPYVNYFSADRAAHSRFQEIIKAGNVQVGARVSQDMQFLFGAYS